VFLDPPYREGVASYAQEADTAGDVWLWALDNADRAGLRIAVCGYEDGRDVPAGWSTFEWEAAGGYSNRANGPGRANAKRERIWFSPQCLDGEVQSSLI